MSLSFPKRTSYLTNKRTSGMAYSLSFSLCTHDYIYVLFSGGQLYSTTIV